MDNEHLSIHSSPPSNPTLIKRVSFTWYAIDEFCRYERLEMIEMKQYNIDAMEGAREKDQMLNELEPVDITFENLTYTVPGPRGKGQKHVLKKISGEFRSGELTAIMGPSGAGKSTLLNILTGFIHSGVTGDISFGNKRDTSAKLCSYILQDDHLFPWFTVQEIMLLAANLKISNKSLSTKKKHVLVENILSTLGLKCTKNTKCSNLSGGQRKRLSIALELLDNPRVLFLDEPTTGLDSSATTECVNLLKQLSTEGRTIVCTIHQPSAAVFYAFSHIYVLADGHCVYRGSPTCTVEFLSSVDLHCPQYHNPADFLLEVTNKEYGDYTAKLVEATKCMDILYIGEDQKFESAHERRRASRTIQYNECIKPPSEWVKLWTLIGRCHIQLYRDWTVTHLKFLCHVLCAIIMGILFGDSGMNASKTFSNLSMLILGILYIWYTTIMPGALKFPLEIAVIKKETFNSWYKLRTYYAATLITTTPIHVIFSLTFAVIVYVTTYQPLELDRFMKFSLSFIILALVADGFGIFFGTLVNPVNGTFIGAVLTAVYSLFSGCFIFFSHMSPIMRVISHISVHRYVYHNLVLSVYDTNRSDFICPPDEIYCHFKKPAKILQMVGMNDGSYFMNILVIFAVTILIKTISYWTLKRALNMQ